MLGAVERLLGVGLPVFGRSGAPLPVSPPYPVEASERAFLSNPWFYACTNAVATDLSGLPLVAETGTGVQRTQTADHALLRLLERPSLKVSGRRFRKQLVADLLSGNAYVRVWRDASRNPVQLGRIPPALIQVQTAADGEEVGWLLPQQGVKLAWDEVLHISDISLSDRPDLVLGTNRMQSLALGLQVDRDSRKMAGRAAKRGRLEMMLSPNGDNARIGEDRVRALTDSYGQAGESGDGVWVVGVGMTATQLSLTARDAEFLGLMDRTQREVLAVFGVPESRVGSAAANYGTAREQSRIYWQSLMALAALIDDELSRLAEPGTRIRHDFSAVDALQPSRSERLARVLQLVSMGMDPNDALRYEGFVDAPVITAKPQAAPAVPPSATPPAPSSPSAEEPRKQAEALVVATLRIIAGLFVDTDATTASVVASDLLERALSDLGATNARPVAREAAAVCEEAIRACEDGDLVDLRAFGPEHAARIVALAGLEVA